MTLYGSAASVWWNGRKQDTAHEEQYLGHPLQAVRIILELIVDNTGQDEEECRESSGLDDVHSVTSLIAHVD